MPTPSGAYYRNLLADEREKARDPRGRSTPSTWPSPTSRPTSTSRPSAWFSRSTPSPRGELSFRGRRVDLGAIRRTALLTVEGEKDDICSIGQTLAAHDLCTGLRPYLRTHYVQAGVGHYGVFSGKRWQNQIYPVVRDVIHVSQ
jgi:hypothetical protein